MTNNQTKCGIKLIILPQQ